MSALTRHPGPVSRIARGGSWLWQRCSLSAWLLAVGLASYLDVARTAVFAYDQADNDPYPGEGTFQTDDNGGTGFQPWAELETGTVWTRFLAPHIIDGHYWAWSMQGACAMGRGLAETVTVGRWDVVAVHGVDNTDFSGFNLKTSTSSADGFATDETLRFGMLGGGDTGIYVSTDAGLNYTLLDCGWIDSTGDTLAYSVGWDSLGQCTLAVNNLTEDKSATFLVSTAPGTVAMLGVAVFGATLDEGITFDQYIVVPEPAGTGLVLAAVALATAAAGLRHRASSWTGR
jgi:hypothetical protein